MESDKCKAAWRGGFAVRYGLVIMPDIRKNWRNLLIDVENKGVVVFIHLGHMFGQDGHGQFPKEADKPADVRKNGKDEL